MMLSQTIKQSKKASFTAIGLMETVVAESTDTFFHLPIQACFQGAAFSQPEAGGPE